MQRLLAAGVVLTLSACASPALPTLTTPPASSTAPNAPVLDCGSLDDATCRSVADAAELMTATPPLSVVVLPETSDGGTPMVERYVVTLEPEGGSTRPQLVEVVRLEGSESWSVRRLEAMPTD